MAGKTRSRSAETRQRRRRALARELDESVLGPDRSEHLYVYADGWSVRRVTRLADQRREGILGRNCLRRAITPLRGILSLRDEDNLPHATFAGFRLGGNTRAEWLLRAATSAELQATIVVENDCLFTLDLLHPNATAYVRRLREFSFARPGAIPRLPPTLRAAIGDLARLHLFTEEEATCKTAGSRYVALLREMECKMKLEETRWGRRPFGLEYQAQTFLVGLGASGDSFARAAR